MWQVRYIRVQTTVTPSWVAWSRIYIYAYYRKWLFITFNWNIFLQYFIGCVFYGTPTISPVSNYGQICADANDGGATVSASGGSGIYTFLVCIKILK